MTDDKIFELFNEIGELTLKFEYEMNMGRRPRFGFPNSYSAIEIFHDKHNAFINASYELTSVHNKIVSYSKGEIDYWLLPSLSRFLQQSRLYFKRYMEYKNLAVHLTEADGNRNCTSGFSPIKKGNIKKDYIIPFDVEDMAND